MDLVTILVLAAIPFAIVPVILLSDTAIYPKKEASGAR